MWVKYLRYSNFKISLDINPFTWSFQWMHQPPAPADPKLHIFYLRILMLSFIVVFDNGTIVRNDLADEVIGDDELL